MGRMVYMHKVDERTQWGRIKWMGRMVYMHKVDEMTQWGRIKWMGQIVYMDKADEGMQQARIDRGRDGQCTWIRRMKGRISGWDG
jgi:hypothetical protein